MHVNSSPTQKAQEVLGRWLVIVVARSIHIKISCLNSQTHSSAQKNCMRKADRKQKKVRNEHVERTSRVNIF